MEATAPAILEIGVVLLLAGAAGWLMRRIGLPAVVGLSGGGAVVVAVHPRVRGRPTSTPALR
jgi:Kef-type K+ transport system membrane component KefB